jgi:hypothetical protein
MSDYSTPSRLGENAATSANAKELFLKVFAGEVLTAFNTKNIGMQLTRVRTITNGKSAQFPLTGVATAQTHTVGTEIAPDSIKHSEKVITIDDLKVASAFIGNIDEAMNHYDVRSIYSKELGEVLAKQADQAIFTKIVAATDDAGTYAQAAAHNHTDVDLSAADGTAGDTTSTDVAAAIIQCLQKLDAADVSGERVAVLDAATYWTMFQGTTSNIAAAMSSDFGSGASVTAGNIPQIGGAKVFMSNNLPASAKGLVFTKDAAATVKLLDLGVESEYQVSRQGTLMVAKYAMGHDSLRPDCAVQIVA